MLSKKMLKVLNEQINLEYYSSTLYLQMSAWCEYKALDGCAKFLRAHAAEEMEHMHRLFTYVNETGSLAVVGQIDAPPVDFESINDVFEETYKHGLFFIDKEVEKMADAEAAGEEV